MDPEIQYDDKWKRKRALANARVRKHREWKRKEAELLKSMTQDKANDEIRKQKIQEMDVQRRKKLERERWRRDQEDMVKIEEKNLQQRRKLAKERSRRYRERKRIEAERLKSMQDKAEKEIRKREIEEMSNQRREELAREGWRRDQGGIKTMENNLQQRRDLAKARSRKYRDRKRLHGLKSGDDVNHDSEIPGPSHGDDPENISRVGNFVKQEDQENLLLPCKEENLQDGFDDDTSNAQFNGSSATYTTDSSKEIEEEEQNQSYKWCCVPSCNNTTKNSPNQIFIHVPNCQEKRVLCSNLFCCEDHLDEMDKAKQDEFNEESKRVRELARARMQEYRKRQRIKAEQLRYERNYEIEKSQIEENSAGLSRGQFQIKEKNVQRQREMSRERSRKYRERKRTDALQSVHHVIDDSQIPGPSHDDDPENVSGVGNFVKQEDEENLLLPCKAENLQIEFDDDTSNAQSNGSSATYNSLKEIEEKEQNQSYKWCCVPSCNSTTKNSPHQIFIHVPNCQEKRVLCSNLFCCEDHLDLTEDAANCGYHKVMGGRIFMKPSVVPPKLQCQPSLRCTQDQSTDSTVDIEEEKLVVEPFTATEPCSPSISSRTSPDATETVFIKAERISPVNIEEFPADPISNGSAKRQKLLFDSSTEMGTSMPSNSSKETQAASTSLTSVFIKEEPHSPVKDEEGSADPLFDDKKRTTVEIGVQTDIKPEYVSMATNCNLDSEEPI